MAVGKLNLDIADRIYEFERLIKEFTIRKILYRIIFRGKGLEFDSFRDYAQDDDASNIDWKASKRVNKLLVKQYIEERDLKIMFVVDVSDNMVFGSTEKLKCEYAAEVCAVLAHLIVNYGDRIGFVFFNGSINKIVLPLGGMRQFNIFVDEISNTSVYGGVSDISKTLDFLLDYLTGSISAVIIVSDFIKMKKSIEPTLKLFANKFETIAIMIRDPLDKTMPKFKGEVIIEDPLSGEQILIDPSIAGRMYEKYAMEQEKMVKDIFDNSGIDFLELNTSEPFPAYMADFLKERTERRKYISPKI